MSNTMIAQMMMAQVEIRPDYLNEDYDAPGGTKYLECRDFERRLEELEQKCELLFEICKDVLEQVAGFNQFSVEVLGLVKEILENEGGNDE